jgi:uncharacterized protein YneF (UPF0154 family)
LATWIWILIALLCLVAGVALGVYIARRYMMNYLEQNPPINEDMIKTLMMQMTQKPSQKKVNRSYSRLLNHRFSSFPRTTEEASKNMKKDMISIMKSYLLIFDYAFHHSSSVETGISCLCPTRLYCVSNVMRSMSGSMKSPKK